MLTTEAVVAEIPEKKKEAPAASGDGRLLTPCRMRDRLQSRIRASLTIRHPSR